MLIDTIISHVQSTRSSDFIQNNDGTLLFYDNSRSKWLSIYRDIFSFGINHNNLTSKHWMINQNKIYSNIHGYIIGKNITLTSMFMRIKNDANIKIFILNDSMEIYSFELFNESEKLITNLNIDVDKFNSVRSYIDVIEGIVNYPLLNIEYATRGG